MLRLVLIASLFVSCPLLQAGIDYRGVNLSAAEFGHYGDSLEGFAQSALPGVYNQDYVYAGPEYFDYFRGLGMNLFRIPIRWERIQPVPGGELDAMELARLNSVVNYATGLGASVIVDIHNYARFHSDTAVSVLGSAELPNSSLSDLWTRLSLEYAANPSVIFGLMNGPYGMNREDVVAFSNEAILAIRGAGATNLILVQGNGYSGGHSWHQDWYGTPNSQAMLSIHDPLGHMAFEVHQ